MIKLYRKHEEKLRNQFLSEALEIVEKPSSPIGSLTIWLITILLVIVVLWAVYGKVDETATARGKIVTADGMQEIQAAKSGSVIKINVSEGSHVNKGDVLYVLDDTLEQGNYEYLINSRDHLQFTIDVLTLLSDNRSILDIDQTDLDKDELSVLLKYQATVNELQSNKLICNNTIENAKEALEAKQTQLDLLQEQVKSKENEKKKVLEFDSNSNEQQETLDSIADKIEFKTKDIEDYQALYDCGAIAKSELDTKKRELKDLENTYEIEKEKVEDEKFNQDLKVTKLDDEIDALNGQIELQKKDITTQTTLIKQEEAKLATLQQNFDKTIQSELIQSNDQYSKNELLIMENEKQKKDLTVKSPCDGTVFQMKVKTLGGVLQAGEAIVSIVPDSSKVEMEAYVLNRDIGNISIGQDVFIKVDTYNYQKYGRVKGQISYISPDAEADNKLGLVYKVKIEILYDSYDHSAMQLINGLSGTVEIKLGERRIIEFFLEPITDMFSESLKIS